jgi:hypothetical protein
LEEDRTVRAGSTDTFGCCLYWKVFDLVGGIGTDNLGDEGKLVELLSGSDLETHRSKEVHRVLQWTDTHDHHLTHSGSRDGRDCLVSCCESPEDEVVKVGVGGCLQEEEVGEWDELDIDIGSAELEADDSISGNQWW